MSALNPNFPNSFSLAIDTSVSTYSQVKDLNVILDSLLSFQWHINNITANFHLWNIIRLNVPICPCPEPRHLPYWLLQFSLLWSLSGPLIRFNKFHNWVACIITKTSSFHRITPVLQDLHLLPLKFRIEFKILIYTFKAIHNLAPPFLSDLLYINNTSNSLRSPSSIHLTVPTVLAVASWGADL